MTHTFTGPLVADVVEALSEYRAHLVDRRAANEARLGAARSLLDQLVKSVDRPVLRASPASILQNSYAAASEQGISVVAWNDWVHRFRSAIQAAAAQRNVHILHEAEFYDTPEPVPERVAALDLVRRIQSNSDPIPGSLASFVDADLNPLNTTYLHEFNPLYFDPAQRPIDPAYVSRIVQSLAVPFPGDVMARERAYATEMLSELRRLLSRTETEYAISVIYRKTPPRTSVVQSPVFKEAMTEYEGMSAELLRRETAFQSRIRRLADSLSSCHRRLSKVGHSLAEIEDKVQAAQVKLQGLAYRTRIGDYLERFWERSRVKVSFTRSITVLRDLRRQQPVWAELLEEAAREGDFGIVEGLEGEISMFRDRLSDSIRAMRRFRQDTIAVRNDLLEEFVPAVEDAVRAEHERDLAPLKLACRRVSHANMQRAQQLKAIQTQFQSVLRNLAGFQRHIEKDIGRPTFVQATLATHRETREALGAILAQRTETVAKRRRMLAAAEAEKGARPVEREEERDDGVGLQYALARLALACHACDREAKVLLVPCSHRICDKCNATSRMEKPVLCPVCQMKVTKAVVIQL
jgi:uncharacterized protein (DUF934 family)